MENSLIFSLIWLCLFFIIQTYGECNPCQTDDCLNGGTCSVNESDCSKVCRCLQSFTGPQCQNNSVSDTAYESTTTEVILQTTLRPLSERTCLFGMLTCLHGYCVGDQRCACDTNWSGLKCNNVICPEDCDGFCEMTNQKIVCSEIDSTTASQNVSLHHRETTILQQQDTTSPTILTSTFSQKDNITAVVQQTTTLKDISVRQCFPGFVCIHGYCQTGSTSLRCICDDHWGGAFCDVLDCQSNCSHGCYLVNNAVKCSEPTQQPISIPQPVSPTTIAANGDITTEYIEATTRSLESRTCMPGFVCVNGYCKRSKVFFHCECDQFWKGPFCDKLNCPHCANGCKLQNDSLICISYPITSTTTKSTTPIPTNSQNTTRTCIPGHLVCVNGYCNKDSTGMYCVCDTHYTGTFCDKLDCKQCASGCSLVNGLPICSSLTTSQPMSTTDITTSFELINGTFPDGHACSANYTPSASTYVVCPIPCNNGKCKLFSDGSFKCVCDPGADGSMCENKCCRPCVNGQCRIDSNKEEYCNCRYDFEGELCDKKIVMKGIEEETWYWWVVAVCLALIVILILALIVLPYLMWRNRVILIMKIVHYFQRYEDNDEREWDAFVSYKCDDKDEAFVLRQLYSKLEVEMGFRLCLHFRDFIPGDTIANNIIRAVQGSRRTIILLTPRYVQSEFTKFEYQMAQTEMLKRRHRIIPLVLEDISSLRKEMDPNLQQIINSVTYLEWPTDEDSVKIQKFWKKLVLSMPKKKDVEERRKALSSSSSPTSYSISSQISEIPLVSHSISTESTNSNGVSVITSNSNGYLSHELIKSNDIFLKIQDDPPEKAANGVKPVSVDKNISSYLDLIYPESVNCSQT